MAKQITVDFLLTRTEYGGQWSLVRHTIEAPALDKKSSEPQVEGSLSIVGIDLHRRQRVTAVFTIED